MPTEPTDRHALKAARHRELAHQRDEIIARFGADPAAQAWLAQFTDGESFLEHYAEQRAKYLVDGPGWRDRAERRAQALRQQADERLWHIQHRKLFLLQCQWRAEQVTLPPDWIQVSLDFEVATHRVHECPFLDPITPDEVDQYCAYLRSEECQDLETYVPIVNGWQFYDKYRLWREAQERGEDPVAAALGPGWEERPRFFISADLSLWRYPEWYAWCDDHVPGLNWLLLPDVRGPKEAYYAQLGEETAPRPAPPPPVAPADPPTPRLPRLDSDDPTMIETLLRRFEPPEMLQYYRALDYSTTEPEHRDRLDRQARAAVDALENVAEPLALLAAPDWRVAIHRTWDAYRREQMVRAVRAAYAAYGRREQAGLPHPPPSERGTSTYQQIAQRYAEHHRAAILNGRQAAGEPADFDF